MKRMVYLTPIILTHYFLIMTEQKSNKPRRSEKVTLADIARKWVLVQ